MGPCVRPSDENEPGRVETNSLAEQEEELSQLEIQAAKWTAKYLLGKADETTIRIFIANAITPKPNMIPAIRLCFPP